MTTICKNARIAQKADDTHYLHISEDQLNVILHCLAQAQGLTASSGTYNVFDHKRLMRQRLNTLAHLIRLNYDSQVYIQGYDSHYDSSQVDHDRLDLQDLLQQLKTEES